MHSNTFNSKSHTLLAFSALGSQTHATRPLFGINPFACSLYEAGFVCGQAVEHASDGDQQASGLMVYKVKALQVENNHIHFSFVSNAWQGGNT